MDFKDRQSGRNQSEQEAWQGRQSQGIKSEQEVSQSQDRQSHGTRRAVAG